MFFSQVPRPAADAKACTRAEPSACYNNQSVYLRIQHPIDRGANVPVGKVRRHAGRREGPRRRRFAKLSGAWLLRKQSLRLWHLRSFCHNYIPSRGDADIAILKALFAQLFQAAAGRANRRQWSRYAASCKPINSTTLDHNQDGASREAL
jgi:hypothetical protein